MKEETLPLRSFSLVRSFLGAALDALGYPLFTETETSWRISTETDVKPLAAGELAQGFGELSVQDAASLISSSCVASANLQFGYEHAFKLVRFIETGEGFVTDSQGQINLLRMFDELQPKVREEIEKLHERLASRDYVIEGAFGEEDGMVVTVGGQNGSTGFRDSLVDWQGYGSLAGWHRQFEGARDPIRTRVTVPLRFVDLLDRVLSDILAPKMGISYISMTGPGAPIRPPELRWNEASIFVSLPDNRGRLLTANWKPSITSVVRIRSSGEERWSPGFETPINGCSFVGLEPGVEYEVNITHRNDAGEGDPAYMTVAPTQVE